MVVGFIFTFLPGVLADSGPKEPGMVCSYNLDDSLMNGSDGVVGTVYPGWYVLYTNINVRLGNKCAAFASGRSAFYDSVSNRLHGSTAFTLGMWDIPGYYGSLQVRAGFVYQQHAIAALDCRFGFSANVATPLVNSYQFIPGGSGVCSPPTYKTTRWRHDLVSWDLVSGRVYGYTDGMVFTQFTVVSNAPLRQYEKLNFGTDDTDPILRTGPCLLDEFMVFNRFISQRDAAALYAYKAVVSAQEQVGCIDGGNQISR